MRASRVVPWMVLVLPGLALAWSHTGTWYTWQDLAVEDAWSLDHDTLPADVGPSRAERSITRAMASWNATDAAVSLTYDSHDPDADLEPDGHFSIFFSDNWEEWGTDQALAFAASWAWEDGAGLDCDVVFLTENQWGDVRWSTSVDPAPSGSYDMEAVAVHELGHCLGLGHSSSSSASMYAYYQGIRTPSQDDEDGLVDLFGDAVCRDADGDGYSVCDADCDDGNAAVSPGAAEVCNGADDNCDGVVDEHAELTVHWADPDGVSSQWSEWVSVGNAFEVDEPTLLRRTRMHMRIDDADVRLNWSVYVADAPTGPWELVRTEIGYSDGDGDQWETSPDLDLPLEDGRIYQVSMGAFGDRVAIFYDRFPPMDPQGPLTPLGYVYTRATGDQFTDPEDEYLAEQELDVVDLPDADGDGETALCGDCDDADPERFTGADELCDEVDNDCDGVVDEGWAEHDADGDGTYDCLDPCPDDAGDDSDGDGSCDSDDPCPDDPTDTCDPEDTDDTDPGLDTDVGGGGEDFLSCACSGAGRASVPWLALGLLGVLGLRRRR